MPLKQFASARYLILNNRKPEDNWSTTARSGSPIPSSRRLDSESFRGGAIRNLNGTRKTDDSNKTRADDVNGTGSQFSYGT